MRLHRKSIFILLGGLAFASAMAGAVSLGQKEPYGFLDGTQLVAIDVQEETMELCYATQTPFAQLLQQVKGELSISQGWEPSESDDQFQVFRNDKLNVEVTVWRPTEDETRAYGVARNEIQVRREKRGDDWRYVLPEAILDLTEPVNSTLTYPRGCGN